jgi:hypothetical protein
MQDASGQPVSLGSGFFVADGIIVVNTDPFLSTCPFTKTVGSTSSAQTPTQPETVYYLTREQTNAVEPDNASGYSLWQHQHDADGTVWREFTGKDGHLYCQEYHEKNGSNTPIMTYPCVKQ